MDPRFLVAECTPQNDKIKTFRLVSSKYIKNKQYHMRIIMLKGSEAG